MGQHSAFIKDSGIGPRDSGPADSLGGQRLLPPSGRLSSRQASRGFGVRLHFSPIWLTMEVDDTARRLWTKIRPRVTAAPVFMAFTLGPVQADLAALKKRRWTDGSIPL